MINIILIDNNQMGAMNQSIFAYTYFIKHNLSMTYFYFLTKTIEKHILDVSFSIFYFILLYFAFFCFVCFDLTFPSK